MFQKTVEGIARASRSAPGPAALVVASWVAGACGVAPAGQPSIDDPTPGTGVTLELNRAPVASRLTPGSRELRGPPPHRSRLHIDAPPPSDPESQLAPSAAPSPAPATSFLASDDNDALASPVAAQVCSPGVAAMSLTASSTWVQSGGSITLTWSVPGGQFCIASSDNPNVTAWSGLLPDTEGSVSIILDQATEFMINCASTYMGSGCRSVDVEIGNGAHACSGSLRKHLSLSAANPHYLQDANGKAELIASYSTLVPTDPSQAKKLAGAPAGEPEYQADADALSTLTYPVRYVRVWHLLPWASDAYWPWAPVTGSTTPAACAGTRRNLTFCPANGSPCTNTLGQTIAPDHIEYPDPSYWPAMKNEAAYSSDRCITSEVMLFDGSGMRAGNWATNPWAYGNNAEDNRAAGFPSLTACNANQDGFGSVYDAAGAVRNAEDAYVHTLVDKISAYDVIFEIENEHKRTTDTSGWEAHWSDFLKNTLQVQRLVSYSVLNVPIGPYQASATPNDFDRALLDPNVDIVNLHVSQDLYVSPTASMRLQALKNLNTFIASRWDKGVTADPNVPGKPINLDEITMGDGDAFRNLAWAVVASGGHIHSEDSAEGVAKPAVENILRFLGPGVAWNFVMSRPSPTLIADTPFCMAPDPGQTSFVGTWDYLCYYSRDNRHSAMRRLKGVPPGEYHVRWWDATSGGFAAGAFNYYPTVTPSAAGDGTVEVPIDPAPDARDWVLLVRNESMGTLKAYRLDNANTGDHLYTTDANENKTVGALAGWIKNGVPFKLFASTAGFGGSDSAHTPLPFYRLYNAGMEQHFWTIDAGERARYASAGWNDETDACFNATGTGPSCGYILPPPATGSECPAGAVRLYRLGLSELMQHVWTTSTLERDAFLDASWTDEGTAGCVVP